MASVSKLHIKGIRSFAPNNNSIIEFFKPLTLIVGANGAGKTTIIESLKYASTGVLPPDSKKGQAFVHDPNISGERETKAQIRLQFKTPSGKSVMVSRSFQLTNKAKKQDFKTLESSLLTVNDQGERVTQSLRCADLDNEIPALMGVSSPILQYVIFCHQEESNWPLGDASTLKKKFDEIFAATRYTKALEILKKQRLELQQEIRVLKERLEKADSDKKKYHQIENDIKETNLKVSTIDQELNNYRVELEELNRRKEEKERLNNEVKAKIQELERLVIEHNELKNKANEYMNMITIFLEGDINEIEEMRINFDKNIEEKKKEKANINSEVNSLKRMISDLQVKYREILDKHAQSVSSEKSKSDLMNQLKTSIENFKKYCDEQGIIIESYEILYDKQHYIGLVDQCKYVVTYQEGQYKALVAQHDSHIERLSREVESIRSKVHQFSADSNRAQYEHDQLMAEIKTMKETIEQKNDVLKKIEDLKSTLENEKILLQNMNDEYDIQFLKQQMDVLSKEKESCESKIKELNQHIQKMKIMKDARVKYDQIQTDLQNKKEKYNSILSEHRDLFKQYMIDIDSMDAKDISSVLEDPLVKINEREASLKETTNELKSKCYAIEGQISLTIENQEARKKNLKEKMKDILEVVGDEDPNKFLKSLNNEIDLLVDEIASLKSSEEIYTSFKKKSTDHHSCPLCDHHLDNIGSFHKKLDQLVSNVPFLITEKKKILDSKKELKQKLELLLPSWREYEAYQEKEEPEYERILKEYRQRHEILETKIKKYESELNDYILQKEEIQSLKKAVKKACDVQNDIDDLKKALYDEEQVLLNNGNIHFNEEEFKDSESNLQVELTRKEEIDQTLSQMQKELYDKTTEIHSKEKYISNIEKEIEIANSSSSNIKFLEADLLQKENVLKTSLSKINEFKQKTQEASSELQSQEDNREKIRSQYKDEENKKKGLLESLNTQISHILILKERIEQIERIPSVDMSIITHEKNEIEKKIEELNQKLETLSTKLSNIQQEIDKSDITKRNMEDNIKYLQAMKHVEILDSVVREKKSMITRTYGYEFPAEITLPIRLDMNLEDFDLLIDAIKNTEGQYREHIGSRRAYLEEIKSKEAMLRSFTSGTNLSVDEIYRQNLIKLKTTEAASKDIDTYYKALDNALMKYHSNQMKNINAIIKELWQATYKGNDIETIEIRSEIDPNSSTQKKRSYNYRVIMVKGDTELDMKGRCSAGQKVLASLVIRLALAETFCLNCGILALDEPTTNLDKSNVESLAQSLISIIEARRKNDNFQLIIITHDEDFVQNLGKSDYTDYYWKVTKNADQQSVIVKKQIIDL